MPVVSFRLSAAQYHDLGVLGLSKPPRTPNRVAKDIVVATLARTCVYGLTMKPKGFAKRSSRPRPRRHSDR